MRLHNKSRMKILITLLSLFALVLSALIMIQPKSRAFFNRILRTDIYGAVSDELPVNLWEKGATVTVFFTPPFTNEYVLALVFKGKAPPFFFKPRGQILIRYYQENTLIREHLYAHNATGSGDTYGKATQIVLDVFVLPQRGGSTLHRAEVQVIEPDSRLEEYKHSTRIVVQGSPYW